MKKLDEKGMALVTSLMMTLVMLVIIIGLWTVMEQSIKANSARMVYRNVTEATYGGTEVVTQDIIPRLFQNYSSTYDIANNYSALNMTLKSNKCLKEKLTLRPSGWVDCGTGSTDVRPTVAPDIKFNLSGPSNNKAYTVYSKIVDTVPGVQFSSGTGGNQLIGSAVAESSAGTTVSLQHYVYTLEVEGQGTTQGADKKLSVLYEY